MYKHLFKLALITGAGSGLGLSLCKLLSEKGIPLIVTGRDSERLAAVAALPHVEEAVCLDLARDRQPLLDLIREKGPDLIINNAGFGLYGPALMHPLRTQMDLLEVNAAAAIEISLEAARALQSRKQPGVILNVSSTAGEFSIPTMALYAASKACLTSFSKSFDAEMRPFCIRVLAALPGPIATEFAARASNNGFVQESGFALKKEYAAECIWKQIERRKPIQIIDWRNRLGIFMMKCLPRSLREHWLQKALRKRFD